MKNYYLVSSNKLNYLICIKHGLWGSRTNKLKNWNIGDQIVLFVEKNVVALAEVISEPFQDETKIWFDDEYPYRVKIKFNYILQESDWIPVGSVKDILIGEYGKKWGMSLIALLPQKEKIYNKLAEKIFSNKNYKYTDIDLRIVQLLKQLSIIEKPAKKKLLKKKEIKLISSTKRGYRGPILNFRGLVYAPVEENGVIFLFSKIAEDIGIFIEGIQKGFPDAFGVRYIGEKGYPVNIEFEYKSSNFRQHQHSPKDCDIIICWENDWKACPIEVIELKEVIKKIKK